jgi:hypothetical protein
MERLQQILIGVCIALFFIIIFLLQCIGSTHTESMIGGFWSVSEKFKDDANIDQLIFYFNDGDGYEYKGYMIMSVDDEVIVNEPVQFRITPKGYFKSDSYTFTMSKKTDMMPRKLTMFLDPYSGKMELKSLEDKKIWAVMFKDNQMSDNTILQIDDMDSADDNGASSAVITELIDDEDGEDGDIL